MSKEKLFETALPIEDYQELKASYKRNDLWKEWYGKYPKLFSDNDRETLTNQARTGHHFHEFLSAVFLLEHFGWLSLVEKSQHRDHKEKHAVIALLDSPELDRAMTFIRTDISPRYGPDLIVYTDDFSEWFFCEVKGPDDKLEDQQTQDYNMVAEKAEKPVRLMEFKKVNEVMKIIMTDYFMPQSGQK